MGNGAGSRESQVPASFCTVLGSASWSYRGLSCLAPENWSQAHSFCIVFHFLYCLIQEKEKEMVGPSPVNSFLLFGTERRDFRA